MKVKITVIIWLLIFWVNPVFCGDGEFERRAFDHAQMEAYKNQKAFQYDSIRPTDRGQGFWEILLSRLLKILAMFFSGEGIMPAIRYFILGLALLFILIRILGMKVNRLLGRKQSPVNSGNYAGEVSGMVALDYEYEAKQAVEQKNIRLAVRFLFLYCLQLLERENLIQRRSEKTNAVYLRELQGKSILPLFRKIVSGYDFVWYGHFNMNEKQFVAYQAQIGQLKNAVTQNS